MKVRQAKDGARTWVDAHAIDLPGFAGAYLAGSICWLDDADEIPRTSDVDVMVVLDGSSTPPKPGKTEFDDILLEISYLPADQFASPEGILTQYHLASSFARTEILADPQDRLSPLQTAVASHFNEPLWIRRRVADARSGVLRFFEANRPDAPFHTNVARWLFANGVTTHILLVAGLRNPTVRTRYAAARGRSDDLRPPRNLRFPSSISSAAAR